MLETGGCGAVTDDEGGRQTARCSAAMLNYPAAARSSSGTRAALSMGDGLTLAGAARAQAGDGIERRQKGCFVFNLAVSFPSDSRGSKARIVLLASRIKRWGLYHIA